MKNILFFFIILSTVKCNRREYKYEYYPDGDLMIKAEIVDGKRDGVVLEYYNDGNLKSRQQWENGRLNGEIEEYYPNGKIEKKGYAKDFHMVAMTYYYESGAVKQVHKYDSEGLVYDIDRFKSDGSRDSIPFPFIHLVDGDTVIKFAPAVLKAKILNAIDPIYKNGKLLIATGFDTLINNDVVVKDTIHIIDPIDDVNYAYPFVPEKEGVDTIYGEFVFSKYDGEYEIITIHNFRYKYYVTKE